MSLALIHFQPLEHYPPVMNCIRDMEEAKVSELKIFSSHSKKNWFSSSYTIYRLGNYTTSRWSRYWTYLYFNFISFFFLCYYRPRKVLYYETYSAWPVYWYKKLFPSVNVFIHFHEYLTEREKNESSAYYKYLLKKETELLKSAYWISHTNEDRMEFFQQDYPFIQKNQCYVFPNYPPADWAMRTQLIRTNRHVSAIKRMVYVGALGFDTTYIKELVDWLAKHQETYTLDIYCNNIEDDVLKYLNKLNFPNISLCKAVSYYELPDLLATYDIGLVLYKGIINNHIYCVPNKIYEYLVCGLEVFCSRELFTTAEFKMKFAIDNLHIINFDDLASSQFDIFDDSERKYYSFEKCNTLINKFK
jgi:hypothetical protein